MHTTSYVSGMTNDAPRPTLSDRNKRAVNARWNPDKRAANIVAKIEQLIEAAEIDFSGNFAEEHFTQADRVRVYKLMGGQTKKKG